MKNHSEHESWGMGKGASVSFEKNYLASAISL